MLIGQYAHNVDAKGRVFIPAKWRSDLGDTIVVTRGGRGGKDDKCLLAMSMDQWEEYSAEFRTVKTLAEMQMLNDDERRAQMAQRMIFSNAADCEVDKQGRILVAPAQREYVGVTGEAVLIGVDKYIEIWNPDSWSEYCRKWDESGL